MQSPDQAWEQRLAQHLACLDEHQPEQFVAQLDLLLAEWPAAELQSPADEPDGAVHAFLALALADLGREREAVAVSLIALSQYLPRYNRSLARYAEALQVRAFP
jgi:Tetratrico peptide repeat